MLVEKKVEITNKKLYFQQNGQPDATHSRRPFSWKIQRRATFAFDPYKVSLSPSRNESSFGNQ
jgi:hypothetical protein